MPNKRVVTGQLTGRLYQQRRETQPWKTDSAAGKRSPSSNKSKRAARCACPLRSTEAPVLLAGGRWARSRLASRSSPRRAKLRRLPESTCTLFSQGLLPREWGPTATATIQNQTAAQRLCFLPRWRTYNPKVAAARRRSSRDRFRRGRPAWGLARRSLSFQVSRG